MGGFAGLGSSFYQVYEQPDEAYGRTRGCDTQCNLLPGWKLEQGSTIPVDIDECNDDPGTTQITITTSPSTTVTAHLAHLARFSTGTSAICSNGATAGFKIQCLPGYAETFPTFYHSHVNDGPWASQTFLYDSGSPVTLKTGTSLECGIQHLATLCNLDTSLMPPASFTIGGCHTISTDCSTEGVSDIFCQCKVGYEQAQPLYVRVDAGQNCIQAGHAYIGTSTECETAAVAIGYSDTGAFVSSASFRTRGCYISTSLGFNTFASTATPADSDALCRALRKHFDPANEGRLLLRWPFDWGGHPCCVAILSAPHG